MAKYITKVSDRTTIKTPEEILKSFNMSTRSLEEMIEKLKKYEIGKDLIKDLELSKAKGWRDIREWKVRNFITRFEAETEEFEMVDDWFLELQDEGYRVKIDVKGRKIVIYTKGVTNADGSPKSRLDRMAQVMNFLVHLNKTERLKVDVKNIRDLNEFFVDYATFDDDDSVEEKEVEENEDEETDDLFEGMTPGDRLRALLRENGRRR